MMENIFSFRTLRQTTSWEKQKVSVISQLNNQRAMSCDSETHSPTSTLEESIETIDGSNWSSDCSNSEDEEQQNTTVVLVSI